MKQYAKNNPSLQNAMDNLKDNKIRIILSLLSFIALFIFGVAISRPLIAMLKAQAPETVNFIQFAPTETFFNSLEIAVLFSLCASLPFFLYNYFMFKYPQMERVNKILLVNTLIAGFSLVLLGITTAYFIVIPMSLYLLLGFSSGMATLDLGISNYISYCLNVIIITCLIFEFPIYFIIVKKTDFINYEKFHENKKKIFIGILIVSFLLTFFTAIFTFIFLTATILLLYGLVLFLAKIFVGQES